MPLQVSKLRGRSPRGSRLIGELLAAWFEFVTRRGCGLAVAQRIGHDAGVPNIAGTQRCLRRIVDELAVLDAHVHALALTRAERNRKRLAAAQAERLDQHTGLPFDREGAKLYARG